MKLPNFDICANCNVDCSGEGDCYNCAFRNPYASAPSGFHERCCTCKKFYPMVLGMPGFTPANWMCDEGYCVNEIGEFIYLCHSVPIHKKRHCAEYLMQACERARLGKMPLTTEEVKKIIIDVNKMR